MARIISCKCCGFPRAEQHHGGFAVCNVCTVIETERIEDGPIRTTGDSVRYAKYRVTEFRCGSAICDKKSYLGSLTRVFEWH